MLRRKKELDVMAKKFKKLGGKIQKKISSLD